MPFPAEHIAIGALVHSSSQGFIRKLWPIQLVAVIVLANAPDFDVFPGIIWKNDWGYYHRLATHSLVFSVLFGVLTALFVNKLSKQKVLCLWTSTAVVFSHVISDYLLSPWPVQFFWPFDSTLYLSHHSWLVYFGLIDQVNRAWFILLSCLIIYACLEWRKQLMIPQYEYPPNDNRRRRVKIIEVEV